MNVISDFFQGNPLSTPIGMMIERATDSNLPSEDWNLYIQICDKINTLEEGPKDAIRALRRRFTTSVGKFNTSALYTLSLLECCVKNCGYRFHLVLATKETLQDFARVVNIPGPVGVGAGTNSLSTGAGNTQGGPRPDVPVIVQEKVLALIQEWADAFAGEVDLKECMHVYEELRGRGIIFPATNLDSMAPIKTPRAMVTTAPAVPSPSRQASVQSQHTRQPQHPMQQPYQLNRRGPPSKMSLPGPPIPITHLTPDQLGKLTRDLDTVQTNTRIFTDLLNEHQHQGAALRPREAVLLMQDLAIVCTQMQSRLVALLGQWEEREDDKAASFLFDLLRVNDELNNVLLRYERFLRCAEGRMAAEEEAAASAAGAPAGLELSSSPPEYHTVSHLLADLESGPAPLGVSEMYAAQQEASLHTASVSGRLSSAVPMRMGKYGPEQQPLIPGIPDTQAELDEMEYWMRTHEGAAPGAVGASTAPMSSTEFDQFLAERTAPALSINGTNSIEPGSTTVPGVMTTPRRQMRKDEKDDAMFAL